MLEELIACSELPVRAVVERLRTMKDEARPTFAAICEGAMLALELTKETVRDERR